MAPGIEEKKEKRSWGSKFFNFLAYGGFLVIIFVIAAIYILITVLWK
jgi:hypothetical protein